MVRRAPDAPLTPRTDRRGRVDIAVYRADTLPAWSPQWHLIEAAWLPNGGIIAGEARQKIERAVNVYLRGESIARTAPFQGDIVERIKRVHTAAVILARTLEAFRQGDGSREARFRLSSFLVSAADDELHLERLPRDLRDVIHAAGMALTELHQEASPSPAAAEGLDAPPFRKWEAWDVLIRQLHDIAETHELPTAIDNHRIGDGDPVPFIDAIMSIEATLSEEFRRHDTRASLSQALLRMIRGKRKGDK